MLAGGVDSALTAAAVAVDGPGPAAPGGGGRTGRVGLGGGGVDDADAACEAPLILLPKARLVFFLRKKASAIASRVVNDVMKQAVDTNPERVGWPILETARRPGPPHPITVVAPATRRKCRSGRWVSGRVGCVVPAVSDFATQRQPIHIYYTPLFLSINSMSAVDSVLKQTARDVAKEAEVGPNAVASKHH